MRHLAVITAALMAGAAAACAVAPRREAPPAVASIPPSGLVDVNVLTDTGGEKPRPEEGETFYPPHPVDTPLPSYPIAALIEGAAPATVAVRIVIGTTGRVEEIADSPVETSTTGPFAGDFREAVETAIRRWRFVPGSYRRLRDGQDLDGDGVPDWRDATERREVAVFYDLRFTFAIIDGEGRVTSANPAAPRS